MPSPCRSYLERIGGVPVRIRASSTSASAPSGKAFTVPPHRRRSGGAWCCRDIAGQVRCRPGAAAAASGRASRDGRGGAVWGGWVVSGAAARRADARPVRQCGPRLAGTCVSRPSVAFWLRTMYDQRVLCVSSGSRFEHARKSWRKAGGERARVGGGVPVRSSGFRRSTAIPGRHGVSSRAPPTSSPHCPAPTFPFLLPPRSSRHRGHAIAQRPKRGR